jgi:hypothetical protein
MLDPGATLDRNLRRSLAWRKSQREVATLISESYPAAIVDKWRIMRENFDRDRSKPNPYKEVEEREFPYLLCLSSFLLVF